MQNLLFPTDSAPLIFRDLKWANRTPYLLAETLQEGKPAGTLERFELTPGAFVGLDNRASTLEDAGLSTGRYCGGYSRSVAEGAGFEQVPCPEGTLIEKGKQCRRCEARDEFSAMHSIHRGAKLASATAQAYADLEHWLYIATFPDGSSKVGTSSLYSRPRRLDEQAVGLATYIAHAQDGRQVRIWEDLVSREAGIIQVKQVKAKYKAWTNPLPSAELSAAHDKAVSLASWTLQEAALFEDFIDEDQLISEAWEPSEPMQVAYRSLQADSPGTLAAHSSLLDSACGFYVLGATGKFLVAHFGDPAQPFLLNLAELVGHAVLPYAQLSPAPQTQGSLF